jgi:sulfide:quinone oxidoreductase
MAPIQVLILGGGIGGVEAAIEARRHHLETLLISDREYLWIYPLSIWIPTGERSKETVKLPLFKLAQRHGFQWKMDEVVAIQEAGAKVQLKSGLILEQGRDYEQLVLALGSGKTQMEGQSNTYSLCGKPSEADQIQEKLKTLVQKGQGSIAVGFGGNPKDPSAVRGGPAFELIFNIDTWLRRKKIRDQFQLTFFAPMADPGIRMGKQAATRSENLLSQKGIQKLFGKKILRFESESIVFEDQSRWESQLILFFAAGTGSKVYQNSGLPLNESGFIRTEPSCQVVGSPHVWAIGDSAALLGPEWKAKQGHIAEVMAKTAIHNMSIKDVQVHQSYVSQVNIVCVMDVGNGAALIYRDDHRGWVLTLPIIGHWLKKAWGIYFRLSKLKWIPRLSGF